VDVIVAAADLMARATQVAANAADVPGQLLFDFDVNRRSTVLGAEYDVEQDVGQ
jgi:hypothetical protein